jgi:hypothetical protein
MDNGKLMTFPVAYKCATCPLWHVGNANPRGPWGKPDFIKAEPTVAIDAP